MVWTILFLGTVTVIILWLKRSRMARMVNRLPGPKTLPLFGNALQLIGPREEIVERGRKLLEPYFEGGIIRLWVGPMPFVICTSPETVEPLLSSSKHIDKSVMYDFLHPWLGLGLLTSTGEKWHSRRKLLTPAFHFRILEDFLPIFNEQSEILVKKLDEQVGKPSFHAFPFVTLCTLDIICATAMGCEINAQTKGDSEYVASVYKASEAAYERMNTPWYFPDILFNLSTLGRENKRATEILHKFTLKVIQERRNEYLKRNHTNSNSEDETFGRKKRLAFLDLLIEYSANGQALSSEDIQEEVDTFMFEGHDTTSAAIFWSLYFLGKIPEIQAKVHEEIDQVVGDSDRHFTFDDLKELKYLECVIKEALRLLPSVPVYGRSIKEDLTIGKHTIPAGVTCLAMPYFVHRHPDHFQESEIFDPSRFEPENTKGRHPYAYIPFSAGPRNCIGQKFAIMEEKVVLGYILRKFKVTTVWDQEFKGIPELIFRPTEDMLMRFERRS